MASALFSALTVVICALCVVMSARFARSAAPGTASLAKRLHLAESQIGYLQESLKLTAAELEHLAQRVKMQRVRNATDHSIKSKSDGDAPDPYKDPEGWRKMMNSKLAKQKIGVNQ